MNAPTDFQAVAPNDLIRARIAVSIAFLLLGFGVGIWAAHIPVVQERLGLTPAILGLALFILAAGSLLSMPVIGWLIGHHGSRIATAIVMVCFVAATPLPVLADSLTLFFLALFLFGIVLGSLDVAANVQAAEVELARRRPTMSSFHGFFSVGAAAGAILSGVIIDQGWGDGSGATTLCVLLLGVAAMAAANLYPSERPIAGGPRFALPSRRVVLIGVLTFLCFASEGAVTDWSALYLTDVKGADPGTAFQGYAAFAGAMAVCRLFGDPIVARLGQKIILAVGGALIALGMAVAIASPWLLGSAVGFGLVGVGAANVVPVLFSAAARIPPSGASVAAATTMGYSGFLIMPVILGFVGERFGLTVSLVIVLLMGAAIAVLAVRRA